MVEGTQSQTGGENPEREIHSITGQKSGDPKARRRSEEAWHTYRHRPNHSTGNDTTTYTNL